MPIETTPTTLADLDASWPLDGDDIDQGDNHIRNIKNVNKLVFKGVGGAGFARAIEATEDEIDTLDGDTVATATTPVSTDRVVYNDAGVMMQVALSTLSNYFRTVAETLTNKTLESPIINNPTVTGATWRELVVLDTPELIISSTTATATWISVFNTTLVNAGATTAILRAYSSSSTSFADTGTFGSGIYIRKTGSGAGTTNGTQATLSIGNDINTSVTARSTQSNDAFVNVSATGGFDYYKYGIGASSYTYTIHLVGYYVPVI